MDPMKIKECPDCASVNVVYVESRDEIVCKECGLVFEELPETTVTLRGKKGRTAKKSLKPKSYKPKPTKKPVKKSKPKGKR